MTRTVAIGDVHGDLDALCNILSGMRVIDDDGNWVGDDLQLVFIGDLNDRGNDSIAVMHLVMRLEDQARTAGGEVHALIGNHEMLVTQQDYRYVRPREYLSVEHFWFGDVNGLDAIYRGEGPFARWIRGRPSMVKLGSTLFVHAGIDERVVRAGMTAVNQLVSDWIRYFQGSGDEPDPETLWLVEQEFNGPLWSDCFHVQGPRKSEKVDLDRLAEWLAAMAAERVVVGHCRTTAIDHAIAFPHPVFGDRVALIDTGISADYGGRLSALEFHADRPVPHYFDREKSDIASALRIETQSFLEAISQ